MLCVWRKCILPVASTGNNPMKGKWTKRSIFVDTPIKTNLKWSSRIKCEFTPAPSARQFVREPDTEIRGPPERDPDRPIWISCWLWWGIDGAWPDQVRSLSPSTPAPSDFALRAILPPYSGSDHSLCETGLRSELHFFDSSTGHRQGFRSRFLVCAFDSAFHSQSTWRPWHAEGWPPLCLSSGPAWRKPPRMWVPLPRLLVLSTNRLLGRWEWLSLSRRRPTPPKDRRRFSPLQRSDTEPLLCCLFDIPTWLTSHVSARIAPNSLHSSWSKWSKCDSFVTMIFLSLVVSSINCLCQFSDVMLFEESVCSLHPFATWMRRACWEMSFIISKWTPFLIRLQFGSLWKCCRSWCPAVWTPRSGRSSLSVVIPSCSTVLRVLDVTTSMATSTLTTWDHGDQPFSDIVTIR